MRGAQHSTAQNGKADVLLYFTFQFDSENNFFCSLRLMRLLIFLSELKNNGFRIDEHESTCASQECWCSNIPSIFIRMKLLSTTEKSHRGDPFHQHTQKKKIFLMLFQYSFLSVLFAQLPCCLFICFVGSVAGGAVGFASIIIVWPEKDVTIKGKRLKHQHDIYKPKHALISLSYWTNSRKSAANTRASRHFPFEFQFSAGISKCRI